MYLLAKGYPNWLWDLTHSLVQCKLCALLCVGKAVGLEPDNSPQSSADVKNE